MAYAPLQAKNATDQTEPEVSAKKAQTEKFPGLQKVWDIDCFLDTIQHVLFMMKPQSEFSSASVKKSTILCTVYFTF